MTPAPDALGARACRARASGSSSFASFALLSTLALHSSGALAAEPEPAPAAAAAAPAAPPLPVREAREISVTAARGERNVLDVPAHVTVIDRAAIERSGAANLPELLRREAGLLTTNTTTNLEGYSVEARGFQSGGGNGCRTLVLVDGRRVNEPDTGCPDWTFLPLENVERIEVVRGPGSAVYGDNAMGGVIQIFTRSGEGKTRASLGTGGGSFDSERADLSASTAFGPLGVGFSSAYDDSAGFRDRSDYNGKRAQLDLSYDLGERGRLGLSGGYGSNERSRPGALFVPYATRDGEQAGPDINVAVEREHFAQGLVELELPAELRLRAVPHYRHSQSRNDAVFSGFPFQFEDDHDSAGVDVQLSRDFTLASLPTRWTSGFEVRKDDYEAASSFATNSAERRVFAFFTHAELTLADAWLLSAGVRYDDSDLEGLLSAPLTECPALRCDFDDEEWSPRVALTWRFADPGALYVSYSEGFRFPNLNEAFGAFGFAPALEPERSKSFELGAKWSAERWQGSATLYHMRVDDEIFFDPLAANPLPGGFPGINENLDEVRHRGVELDAAYQVLDWLELSGAYTYDDVEVREDGRASFEGEQLPITPRHRGNLGVRATLPFGFEASVHATYVGERRLANDVDADSDLLPSYATYDARVGWRGELAPGVTLLLEGIGRNLTNRHYAEWGGFGSFSPAIGYFPSPERNFSAGARITFER